MKALFIGGSGYIGRNLMLLMGHEETDYYSRHKLEGKEFEKFNWIEGDVSDHEKLVPLIKNYDTIYYLSNSYSANEDEAMKVNVFGIKAVANEVKRIDKNQRLIYFSSINVHYGKNEYFRTRRTGEDNASLVKNHLIVRLSFVFGGHNDSFINLINQLYSKGVDRLPKEGRASPTHIEDLAETIKKSSGITGAIYANSSSQLTFLDCMNIYGKKMGKPEIKEAGGILSRHAGEKLVEEGKIDKITLDRILEDYFREASSVIRFIKDQKKFEDYVQNLPKA